MTYEQRISKAVEELKKAGNAQENPAFVGLGDAERILRESLLAEHLATREEVRGMVEKMSETGDSAKQNWINVKDLLSLLTSQTNPPQEQA